MANFDNLEHDSNNTLKENFITLDDGNTYLMLFIGGGASDQIYKCSWDKRFSKYGGTIAPFGSVEFMYDSENTPERIGFRLEYSTEFKEYLNRLLATKTVQEKWTGGPSMITVEVRNRSNSQELANAQIYPGNYDAPDWREYYSGLRNFIPLRDNNISPYTLRDGLILDCRLSLSGNTPNEGGGFYNPSTDKARWALISCNVRLEPWNLLNGSRTDINNYNNTIMCGSMTLNCSKGSTSLNLNWDYFSFSGAFADPEYWEICINGECVADSDRYGQINSVNCEEVFVYSNSSSWGSIYPCE